VALQKKSLRASEQDRSDVKQARAIWRECQPRVDANQLVFLDETGLSTDMARLRGWGWGGQRVIDATPCGRWHTNSLISAITPDGVLAAMLLDGPLNGNWFTHFCDHLLGPVLPPGSMVVLDNLGAHKVSAAATALERIGCSLAFLPAYSPDLNPIENIYAKVKSIVRKLRPRTWDQIVDATREALLAITSQDCQHCIEHCGYELL